MIAIAIAIAANFETVVAQIVHAFAENRLDVIIPGAAFLTLRAAPILPRADEGQVLMTGDDDTPTGRGIALL